MSTRKTTLFYVVLIGVASMAIGMVIASRLDLAPASLAQATMTVPEKNSAPLSGGVDAETFRNIARAQTPMVVNIRTEQRRRTQDLSEFFGGDEMFRRFFGEPQPRGGRPREQVTQSAGTGFIIDKSGLILTNSHVVEGATKIEVGFFGGDDEEFYDAKVVGRDQLTDSALIELTEKPKREMAVARFGDSDQLQPGDWVMAIGNPFNLGHTVTVGVISAKGRPFFPVPGREAGHAPDRRRDQPGQLRRAAAQHPRRGRRHQHRHLRRHAGRNLGIGFAVPINAIRELLPQLRAGKVVRGRIGVSLSRLVKRDVLEEMGAKDGRGALVQSVESAPRRSGGREAGRRHRRVQRQARRRQRRPGGPGGPHRARYDGAPEGPP